MVAGIAPAGDGCALGIETKNAKHRAAALVELDFGGARLDALVNRIVAGALALHLDLPKRRTRDGMGDHDAQRDRRMARQFGAHRRMAVQIDIAGQRRGQFGSCHLGQHRPILTLGLGLAEPLAFFLRDIALVEGDFAAIVDRDIDTPALALGGFFMLPSREMALRRDDLDGAPAIFEILGFALLDFGRLRRPKSIAVREIAALLEQVGDDLAGIIGHVEQRCLDRNRAAAEQPCFQLLPAWGTAVLAVEQRQPCLLLRLGRKGQVADCLGVNFLGAVSVAGARQQVAEHEDSLHL